MVPTFHDTAFGVTVLPETTLQTRTLTVFAALTQADQLRLVLPKEDAGLAMATIDVVAPVTVMVWSWQVFVNGE